MPLTPQNDSPSNAILLSGALNSFRDGGRGGNDQFFNNLISGLLADRRQKRQGTEAMRRFLVQSGLSPDLADNLPGASKAIADQKKAAAELTAAGVRESRDRFNISLAAQHPRGPQYVLGEGGPAKWKSGIQSIASQLPGAEQYRLLRDATTGARGEPLRPQFSSDVLGADALDAIVGDVSGYPEDHPLRLKLERLKGIAAEQELRLPTRSKSITPKVEPITIARADLEKIEKKPQYSEALSSLGWLNVMEKAITSTTTLGGGISGPADYALIMGFNKILDPNSVTREGEFDRAAALGGKTSRWRRALGQYRALAEHIAGISDLATMDDDAKDAMSAMITPDVRIAMVSMARLSVTERIAPLNRQISQRRGLFESQFDLADVHPGIRNVYEPLTIEGLRQFAPTFSQEELRGAPRLPAPIETDGDVEMEVYVDKNGVVRERPVGGPGE